MSVKAKRTNGSLMSCRAIADAQLGSALHNDIIRTQLPLVGRHQLDVAG
jgi:hypothetical protein